MTLQLIERPFFNDRLVFDQNSFLKIANSFFNFILSLFYIAPQNYTDQNRKTIECFKKYLIDRIGENRLDRVLSKMSIDLDKLQTNGYYLNSKVVTKILVGIKDVSIYDMQEVIDIVNSDKNAFLHLGSHILKKLKKVKKATQLDSDTFEKLYKALATPIDKITYKPIEGVISGKATKFLSRIIYDYYLEVKERLQICETNHLLSIEGFYEKLCKVIVNRIMEVGAIIKAPNDQKNKPRYYRVAARLVTAQGNISYALIPATDDTKGLEKIRVTKGSGLKLANIDMLSYYITDMEKDIGETPFESAKKYEKYFSRLGIITTEMGHSAGGAITQHRAAFYPRIRRAYLYNSPGVSKQVRDRFNEREKPFHIYITRSQNDSVDKAGSHHLGDKAKDNVQIYFKEYIKDRKDPSIRKIHPHNIVFAQDAKKSQLTGGVYELNNLKRSYLENIRWLFGGHLLSPFLRIIQAVTRRVFISNAQRLSGLFIEDIHAKKYYVKYISDARANVRLNLLTTFTVV